MQKQIQVVTPRGIVLPGELFTGGKSDTVLIAITGIHGNFYSNPFYYTIGNTLNAHGYDFIYAPTTDFTNQFRSVNVTTRQHVLLGSLNERFADSDDDIQGYVNYAAANGYIHIYLAGHSLGANKVIHYLAGQHSPVVKHFLLMSPIDMDYMTANVSPKERQIVRRMVESGHGQDLLPFPLMGWVECTADTAYDWLFSPMLRNVHGDPDGDFSEAAKITHSGALLIGTYDTFTEGKPENYLLNLNRHMPREKENKLIFIEKTGHTYQQKERELADEILKLITNWNKEN